jgi:cellulose synthase/poly-beta-1,6-N-acetylglucosamine synthase-like glycosyltransferase
MDIIFIILSIIVLLQSLVALAAVIRFARYCLRPKAARPNRYQPKAVVIVPCKGLEEDFDENIRALFLQDYRDYEIIFVAESESDPAYAALSKLIKQFRRSAWMVVAGEARGCGQKVHNLCAAIDMLNSIDRRAEVFVFADSDARTHRSWLSELIAPLGDKKIGATTGFRWYLSSTSDRRLGGSLGSILLSVWNASAVSLLGSRSSFAWGGSMAIRRENFDRLGVMKRWKGAVSDDYALSSAIHEAGQRIKFVPQCLIPSYTNATVRELLEFTTRQIRITRVYSPGVWKLAGFSNFLYNLAFWGGLLWVIFEGFKGAVSQTLALSLIGIFALGAISGWVRAGVAAALLKSDRERIQRQWWAYAMLGPVVSLIYLYNVIASARTTRIIWRGIGYDLISPNETVIWRRPAQLNSTDAGSRSARKRKASVRSSSQK